MFFEERWRFSLHSQISAYFRAMPMPREAPCLRRRAQFSRHALFDFFRLFHRVFRHLPMIADAAPIYYRFPRRSSFTPFRPRHACRRRDVVTDSFFS